MTELLRTERLVLRAWEDDDLDAFFDLYGRDEVMRWLGPQPRRAIPSRDHAAKSLPRWRERHASFSAPLGLWAVVPTHLDHPVGTALLLPLEDSDEVEVGWHLHPDHHGNGYATEAARALLEAGQAAGMTGVLALTDLDNLPSQAVARRLGMVDEGTTDRWFGLTMRQYRSA